MSTRKHILLLAMVVAVNACGSEDLILIEPIPDPDSVYASAPFASAALAPLTATRPGEQAFVDLASYDPTFAGYYFLDGNHLVVATTDTSRSEEIRRAATDKLSQISPSGTLVPDQVTIRQVDYSFRQLSLWRDMIEYSLLDIDDVVAVDLDEILNRITVYLDTGSGANRVRSIADQVQIPEAALHFEVSGNIEPAVDLRPLTDMKLTDRIRPVKGGIQVARRINSQHMEPCTLGFTATMKSYSGPQIVQDTVYLTNSHCTSTNFHVDGDIGWQPTPTGWESDKIGIETADPPPDHYNGDTPLRDSDAAAFDLLLSPDRYALGKIARTTYRTFGAGAARGSIIISSSNPHFTVSGEWTWPVAGRYYQKMGRTSGWTYGGIQATCSTVKSGGKYITCAYKINTRTEDGDSGAPVFEWPDASVDAVYLAGMMFGRSTWSGKGWFNPMGAIEDDLGPLGTTF